MSLVRQVRPDMTTSDRRDYAVALMAASLVELMHGYRSRPSRVQLTPLTTGGDNRSTLVILPEDAAAEIWPRAVVVPRPAGLEPPRALVCLRDGLTADSTGRTLPEVRRAAEVDCSTPTTLTIHQALQDPAHGYLQI